MIKEDNGKMFGKWKDEVSILLYEDINKHISKYVKKIDTVGDYGGANGLLGKSLKCKKYTVIDYDESKKDNNNFINDNIITHKGEYDTVVLKLVLHYLKDIEIKRMLENIKAKNIIIVQFVNSGIDLKIKQEISKDSNEKKKYFRTKTELLNILYDFKEVDKFDYIVTSDFYKNRLQIDTYLQHKETLLILRKNNDN